MALLALGLSALVAGSVAWGYLRTGNFPGELQRHAWLSRATALVNPCDLGSSGDGSNLLGGAQPVASPPVSRSMLAETRYARLLGRASFGERPGELDAIRAEGAESWLERQLAAPSEPSAALARRLRAFPALGLEVAALTKGMDLPRPTRGAADPPSRQDIARFMKVGKRAREIARDVASARIVRAVHDERGLREVMVDFFSNHLSVFALKGPIGGLLPHYAREVIEPHALGRFTDMLLASARSPAMLFYLDNWRSTAPGRAFRRGKGGINENYARELLELHSVGIDGGYTQDDVVQTARVLTGWTLESRRDPSFRFRPMLHEGGAKTVLGARIPGSGVEEGEALLARLALHPSTARHLARKLCARFVCDSPPEPLVERAARRYLEADGEVRPMLREILLSPEFAAPENRKLKTPLRLFASALRAHDGETEAGGPALLLLARLGELPYFARTPKGFPEDAARWVDPGSLLQRMSLGFALAGGHVAGTRVGVSGAAAERVALAISSPEFQWS